MEIDTEMLLFENKHYGQLRNQQPAITQKEFI
jgi:hypothetical protein